MQKILYLSLGGIAGTLARYFFAGALYEMLGTRFPYGTLVVNITGCFILGVLVSFSESKFLLNSDLKVLLMVGFCGAYTTFSTFILETSNLVKDGESMRAFMNVILSVAVGFLIFRFGVLLGDIL